MDQPTFASLDFAGKKKRTKRDLFLAEMAAVVPWAMPAAVIEPHYPKVGPEGERRLVDPQPLVVAQSIEVHPSASLVAATLETEKK